MTYLSSDIFAGLNNDERKLQPWEIESRLPGRPAIKDLGSAVSDKAGYWYVDAAFHSANTYGELMFWEWLAKGSVNMDHIAVANQKIGFQVGQPGCGAPSSPWQYDSYRNHMSTAKHGNGTHNMVWMDRYNFFRDKPAEDPFWSVPILVDRVLTGHQGRDEITSNANVTNIGLALWRVMRDFNDRVGLFNGAFVCRDQTDALVLAPYCEMLGVLRTIADPEETANVSSMV